MLRELLTNEIYSVSGGAAFEEIYPPAIPGYQIVGWTQQIVGYDTYSWKEKKDFFNEIVHEYTTPIYQILPIYAPSPPATIIYY